MHELPFKRIMVIFSISILSFLVLSNTVYAQSALDDRFRTEMIKRIGSNNYSTFMKILHSGLRMYLLSKVL